MMNTYLFDMTDKKVTKHSSHLQVNIKYPSGNRTMNVDDKNSASVIINLAHGIYCTAFKLALENEGRRHVFYHHGQGVSRNVQKEIQLCS